MAKGRSGTSFPPSPCLPHPEDRAMPYMVILIVLMMLTLLASCFALV